MKRLFSFDANPVLLYELRQMVRNRTVIMLMALYLAAMVGFLGMLLVGRQSGNPIDFDGVFFSWGYHSGTSYETRSAMVVFLIYYMFTSITLVAFAAFKTASDCLQESPGYSTTLRSRQMVMGKMLFGIVLSLLFLTMTLPFLSVVYLLRGLDIRLLPMLAFMSFAMTQLHYFTTMALFLGAKNRRRLVALLLPWLGIQLLFAMFSMTSVCDLAASFVLYNRGMETWIGLAVLILLFFLSMLSIFILAMVQVAPEASNRMLPVRVTISIVQLLLGIPLLIVCIVGVFKKLDWNELSYVVVPNMLVWVVLPFLFVFFICERADWSPRIRRTIPRSFWRRLLVFPFYTGVANAMAWSFLSLLWMSFLVAFFGSVFFSSLGSVVDFNAAVVGTATNGVLLFNYCATTLLLYNIVFYRWISRQWNWLPLVVFMVLFILFYVFIEVFGNIFGIDFLPSLLDLPFLPQPWFQGKMDFVIQQGLIAAVWLLLLALPGISWLYGNFKRFRGE